MQLWSRSFASCRSAILNQLETTAALQRVVVCKPTGTSISNVRSARLRANPRSTFAAPPRGHRACAVANKQQIHSKQCGRYGLLPSRAIDSVRSLHGRSGGRRSFSSAVSAVAAPELCIEPGQVHIHWLDPAKDERDFVAAASRAEQRRDRILSRVLVRTTLVKYCSTLGPQALIFARGLQGKPELAGPADALVGGLRFNASNTGGMQGCAVACGAAVGLDIESASRITRKDPSSVARRQFSPAELAALDEIQGHEERRLHFLRLWTLKEAYVKALGRGIRAKPGLRSFTVELDGLTQQQSGSENVQPNVQQPPLQYQQPGDGKQTRLGTVRFSTEVEHERTKKWDFCLLQPKPSFTAALCLERHAGGIAGDFRTPATLRMWQTVPLVGHERIEGSHLLLAVT